MKVFWFAALAIAGLAVAQKGEFTYRDSSGNLVVTAKGGKVTRLTDGFRLNLGGPVTLTSKTQSMTIKAGSVEANLAGGSTMRVTSATAANGFNLIKNAADRMSQITGAKATLTSGSSADQVTISGPVSILATDASKRQTLNASGTSGTASFSNSGANRGGLLKAGLDGPVKVTLLEFTNDGKPSKIVVTGNRLSIDGQESPTVTVTGNVKISGEGASTFGTFSNLGKAVFKLNAKGEVVNSEMEASSS